MAERTLTIYKIRPNLSIESIIKNHRDRQYTQIAAGNAQFEVFAKKGSSHYPHWAPFFEGKLPTSFIWEVDQPGLVLLVSANNTLFALTFGQGRHMLMTNCYETNFGKKVVINSVTTVRSLEKKAFDAISGHSITQAAFETDINDFGFNIERELLRAVTGTPVDESLGKRMSGVDALSVSVDVELDNLVNLLTKYDDASKSDKYKEKFGFVDHMSAVESEDLLGFLDELTQEELERVSESVIKHETYKTEFFVAVPVIVDFGVVPDFAYSKSKTFPRRRDISLRSFIEFLNSKGYSMSVDDLKRRDIYAYQSDGTVAHSWNAFRCLNGELDFDGSRYILSDGNWYRIERDYMKILERDLSTIPPYDLTLPLYRGGKEDEYCQSVADEDKEFYYFNTDWVRPYSNQKYEFCDLYTEKADFRDLIHAKRGIKIDQLSHLFSQGKVSCDAYFGFEDCRIQVETKLKKAMGDELYDRADRPKEIRTVFAIVSDQGNYLTFFSKVNLRQASNDLKAANRKFALAFVGFEDEYKKIT